MSGLTLSFQSLGPVQLPVRMTRPSLPPRANTTPDAVKAVTLYPAQILNVADRLGSIEVGKMANLVVTDGDLLEIRTRIRYLLIDGRPVVLTSRHTELNDAFKNRK